MKRKKRPVTLTFTAKEFDLLISLVGLGVFVMSGYPTERSSFEDILAESDDDDIDAVLGKLQGVFWEGALQTEFKKFAKDRPN